MNDDMDAATYRTLINAGYTSDSVTEAVLYDDMTLLRHSGPFDVRLTEEKDR